MAECIKREDMSYPVVAHWNSDGSCSNCGKCRKPYDLSQRDYCPNCGAEMSEVFTPPTKKQLSFACIIQSALDHDGFHVFGTGDSYRNMHEMSKWELRDFIANVLSNEENKKKVDEYIRVRNMEKRREAKYYAKLQEEERRKRKDRYSGCYTDEALGGEWGLDACDFGAQAWGDS